jgi:hypothetical protein
MLTKISEIILKYRLSAGENARKKQFLPWEKIEKIALVITNGDMVAKNTIDKFVLDSRKFIEVFYIEVNSSKRSYSDWQCFSRKDRSLFRLPNRQLTRELGKKKFDLVINTGSNDDVFSRGVSGLLSAPLKCAAAGFREVDLVIERPGNYQLLNYLEEVVRYLKMIRP